MRFAARRGIVFFVCAVLFLSVSASMAQTPEAAKSDTAIYRDAERNTGGSSNILTCKPTTVDGQTTILTCKPTPADGQTPQDDRRKSSDREDESQTSEESQERTNDVPVDEVPSDFQRFIANSIGRILPVFGRSFFTAAFSPITGVPAPTDYIIGPGDEIILRVWGQQNFDFELHVNRDGEVFIPQVGSITLAGLQYRQLHDHLKMRLGRVFKNFDLSVSMGRLRTIQIYVTGNAARPGRHTISSLSTMLNAVGASGGPRSHGTMRRIQLIRNGQTVTELDLYDMLLKGDKTGDVRLLPEDIIHIPVVGRQVAVSGSVRTPAIYEIKNEKTVGEVIEMAMGFSNVANRDRATIERIRGGVSREVVDLFLNDGGLSELVADGDLLQVLKISPRFDDTVTLRGNAASPGRFSWRPGMRLRDIIPDKESLISSGYWTRRNLFGSFYHEEISPMGVGTSVADINWSYAVIERQNEKDLRTNWIPFNLGKLVLENDESQNLELRSGDVVMIFTQADVQVPQMRRTRTITMQGEVNVPGIYTVEPGETLGHLIAKAGGLTPEAYLYGSEFTRESTRRFQQERLNNYIDELEAEMSVTARNRLSSAADSEDAGLAAAEMESQRQVIGRMRALRSSGRIVMDVLKPESNDVSKIAGFVLEDGDVFTVPVRSSVINVIGEVYNPSAFIHVGGRQVKEYLRIAGGFTREADKKHVYVIRVDGSIMPKQSVSKFDRLRLTPGDSLMIPARMQKPSLMREMRGWSQVLSQFGLGVAAINEIVRR